MKHYGTISEGTIELNEYVADTTKGNDALSETEKPKKSIWSRVKRLFQNFFDKVGDKSFDISHKTSDDLLKKKYFDDDTDNFKLSKGGMFNLGI
jgi:hypothetical protein